ncbi:potassium-transporting ATPase subunit C [Lacticaseibacillus paracasei]|uniref:potassium-transporting ATPase subunit C n=1 Tax=Lacticaseibacillus paracasei TaxID=1597 RepID=UPI001EDE22EB|nr:potassium-transporting ATPase subunit C [Lacticaseibacillus paracasei]MCG4285486.1 potassium-transporting ATPase subunit C [Lacticaseibacillus paracasei]
MQKILIRASGILLLIMVVTGLYTAVMTAIGQTFMPVQANGSLITRNKKIVTGSTKIARPLSDDKDLWGRAMTITTDKTGVLKAGASNISPNDKTYQKHLKSLRDEILKRNPASSSSVPEELLTTSGSGVDPDISLSAAIWQVPRIAKARGLNKSSVLKVIHAQSSPTLDKILGEQTVNVLLVNQALNKFKD